MTKHTESIFVIGVIAPGVLLIAMLAGVLFARGKLEDAKATKRTAWQEHEQSMVALQKAESEFSGKEGSLDTWKDSIGKELIQTLSQTLRDAMVGYSDQQLRQTELSRPGGSSRIAGATENKYDRFMLSFEGGFGPMQRVLAILETTMPQLVLEDLSISPVAKAANSDSGRRLKFAVTYLSWRAED
jgi:hypothetical protein